MVGGWEWLDTRVYDAYRICVSSSPLVVQVIRTMATIGFNVEKVTHQNINFVLWDLGGQANIRYDRV